MTETEDRYDRQRRLAEVGTTGQERLQRATAEVRGRDGATVELAYLCRAGLSEVAMVPGKQAEPFGHAEWFRFDSCRSVGAGAWRALATIKKVLELETR
jgi:hypothetical protein